MVIVQLRDCIRTDRARWVAESSTLQWPIGRWPELIQIEGGEGDAIIMSRAHELYNGAVHVYVNEQGAELHVLND